MTYNYLIGIDIGGTKCSITLGTGVRPKGDEGFIMDKEIFPTNQPRGFKVIMNEIYETIDKILNRNEIKKEQLVGIGISCGGPLDSKKGIIKSPPNLPGWDNIHITDMLTERYGVPASLQNDANACAVAEWKFGSGRGYNNVVFLTFGTGLGAGLILDGKLYTGTNDMAGEVGHIRLEKEGPLGYGKFGSFEGFCSGGGIPRLARIMAIDYYNEHKKMPDVDMTSAKTIAQAADAGNEFALEVYRNCAHHLGMGLSIIVDILNPEVIVIGSIYKRSNHLFYDIVMKTLEKEAVPVALGVCKVVPAMLGDEIGDYAALGVAYANIFGEN